MENKVAIVFYGYPVGVSVMIINAARMFAEKGFDVDIIQIQSALDYSSVEFTEKNIRYIPVAGGDDSGDADSSKPGNGKKSFRKKLKGNLAFFIRFLFFLISPLLGKLPGLHLYLLKFCKPDFHRYLKKIIGLRDDSYQYIVGIEVLGLYTAHILKSNPGQKIIYFNMELFKLSTSRLPDRYLRGALESFVLKNNIDHIAIANKERIKVFLNDKKYIPASMVEMLPVASLGEPYLEKGNYFREKFNIPDDKTIVLYSGNIVEWAMCLEIVESVKNWGDEFVLVLHTYIEHPQNEDYYDLIEKAMLPGRVFISQKHFSFWELDKILSSAEIGLLFYREKDENFTEIGFSSNKLTQYLKTGMPIITNDLPFFSKFFDEHKCGKCVSSFEEIAGTISEISRDYSVYRKNAVSCYENYFDFRKYFNVFMKNIQAN